MYVEENKVHKIFEQKAENEAIHHATSQYTPSNIIISNK